MYRPNVSKRGFDPMSTQTMQSAAHRRMAMAVFGLAGALIAFYLSLFRLGLLGKLACGTSGGCETVQLSPWSSLFGIPIPYMGAVFYTAIVITAVLATTRKGLLSQGLRFTVVVLSCCAFGFAVYNTSIEALVIHAWCRWCLACASCAAVLFGLSIAELVAGRVVPNDAPLPEEPTIAVV